MKQKGRTTKYDTIIKPKLEEIKKWSQSGATGKQIAGNLGIAESTLYKYKDEHQELASAIDDGRKSLVIELRGALIQKALGIKTTVKKGMKCKSVYYDDSGKRCEREEVEIYEEEIYIPPDVAALNLALKNYDKEKLGKRPAATRAKKGRIKIQKRTGRKKTIGR